MFFLISFFKTKSIFKKELLPGKHWAEERTRISVDKRTVCMQTSPVMATLDVSRAMFSSLTPIYRVSHAFLPRPLVLLNSFPHVLSLSHSLPHLHPALTLPICVSRDTNAQFSEYSEGAEEEFLEDDDSDGFVDYDDDSPTGQSVDELEEEANRAVREYSRALKRELSIGK